MAYTSISPVHVEGSADGDPPHWDDWFEALLVELRLMNDLLTDIRDGLRPRRPPPKK